jgi:Ca-activated chloride channel homolog
VKDASALATFLHRELDETAATTIENATVRLHLPHGVRFVSASGADAKSMATNVVDSDEVELRLGSLFAKDERRVIVHLSTRADLGDSLPFDGTATWMKIGGAETSTAFSGIKLATTTDSAAVEAGADHGVLADAMSVIASERELKAAEAYAHGDTTTANALIDQNIHDLKQAAILAPAPAATSLDKQWQAYEGSKKAFAAPPQSAPGKAAAKRAFEVDSSNMARSAF